MRAGYVALIWPPMSDDGARRVEDLVHGMGAAGWTSASATEGLHVWTTARSPPAVRCLAGDSGVVIGHLI
jgi:hypothetical protein